MNTKKDDFPESILNAIKELHKEGEDKKLDAAIVSIGRWIQGPYKLKQYTIKYKVLGSHIEMHATIYFNCIKVTKNDKGKFVSIPALDAVRKERFKMEVGKLDNHIDHIIVHGKEVKIKIVWSNWTYEDAEFSVKKIRGSIKPIVERYSR